MKKTLLLLATVASIALVGCTSQPATPSATTPTMIKIGVIAPISGPAASIGTDAVNTFKMAADAFNKAHTDMQIQLIIEDGKCDGKDATSAAQKLVNVDQVKIILGGVCSSETLAAAKITEPAGVVLLSSVSSSPEISKSTNYTYRYYNDLNQTATMKAYLDKSGFKKIALTYENTDYGVGFANALKNLVGAENVIVDEKFNTDEKDFSIIAKKISAKKNDIQAIVVVPNNDVTNVGMIRALEQEGLTDSFRGKILGAETVASADALKQLTAAMEGMISSQLPDITNMGKSAADFIAEAKTIFTPAFGETFLILYKEAFDLVARSIVDPAYGPTKINDYIRSITKTSPTSGLFGSYYFDGADVVGVSFVMKKVEAGKLVPLQ